MPTKRSLWLLPALCLWACAQIGTTENEVFPSGPVPEDPLALAPDSADGVGNEAGPESTDEGSDPIGRSGDPIGRNGDPIGWNGPWRQP